MTSDRFLHDPELRCPFCNEAHGTYCVKAHERIKRLEAELAAAVDEIEMLQGLVRKLTDDVGANFDRRDLWWYEPSPVVTLTDREWLAVFGPEVEDDEDDATSHDVKAHTPDLAERPLPPCMVLHRRLSLVCCRDAGHQGAHVATGSEGQVYAVWCDDDASPSESTALRSGPSLYLNTDGIWTPAPGDGRR
jgi:hypothetical protein